MDKITVTLSFEEYMVLMKNKWRVETVAEFLNKYGDLVSVDQIIAILNLEVQKNA